ncbi:fibropellin-1-like [Dreissena polymorpha]|uniref:EGF-like domain-containing protein n=1 Tax=Dreissena polymorpha TaxID=45954 RepID=A0A9D4LJV2_DREPO|nr:fibropellin-1-like [Dreissena polymorpha]KAH3860075.1 hypothetical protein DPMN_022968 [Dreissena polymorpha]
MAALYFSCLIMILWPLHTACWDGNEHSHNTPCDYCKNGGSCEYSGHRDIWCHCQSGYTGDRCEDVVHGNGNSVEKCETRIPCQNGGTCYFDQNHQPICNCVPGYTGPLCAASVTITTITAISTTAAIITATSTTAATTTAISTTTATTPSTTTGSTIWTATNPACVNYDNSVHPCKDNSACTLPHVKGVICPDLNEAHYCPVTCGCCNNATTTTIMP